MQAINFAGNAELTGRLYRQQLNRNVYIPLNPQATAAMTRKALADVTIEFEGEFSATVRDAFLREFTSVVQYFAERHNLVTTQPIKILVVEHYDLHYGSRTIVLNEGFLGEVAHEYVHALQDELSGGALGPRWIVEGGAVHFEYLYDHAVGWWPIRESVATLENARGIRESLEDIESNIVGTDVEKYALGHLATRYLITLAGEEALWDFYREYASTRSWKGAFEEAFGLSVQEFYQAFEAHRALVLPPLPVIRGVVLGPDGEPAEGILVWSLSYFDDGTFSGWLDFTERDGSFTVAAEGDEVRLSLQHPVCGDVYGYVDSAGDIVPGGIDAKPAARLFDFDGATKGDDKTPVQLFDLQEDPNENENVVDDPAYAAVIEELMREHALPFLETPPLRPARGIWEVMEGLYKGIATWRCDTRGRTALARATGDPARALASRTTRPPPIQRFALQYRLAYQSPANRDCTANSAERVGAVAS